MAVSEFRSTNNIYTFRPIRSQRDSPRRDYTEVPHQTDIYSDHSFVNAGVRYKNVEPSTGYQSRVQEVSIEDEVVD